MAYSYVQYVGNGATTSFSIPFQYISTDHIEVRLNGVLQVSGYSFPSASSVQFDVAPGVDVVVEVRRVTPKDVRLVDFQNGSILNEASLDLSADQGFFAVQETLDDGEAALKLGSDGTYDVGNHRIKNVATPVNDNDAVNKAFIQPSVDAAAASAAAASSSASAASTSASAADASAIAAAASAVAADASADAAAASAVEAASYASGATFEILNTNGDVGTGADQVAVGNHSHTDKANEASLQTVVIPAGAMKPRETLGAELKTITLSGNNTLVTSLNFDPAVQEFAQFGIPMPKGCDLSAGFTMRFEWSHPATDTNFGVAWDVKAKAVSDDDPLDGAWSTPVQANDVGGTTDDHYKSAYTATINPAGTPAQFDTILFEISRVATDVTNDTLAVDARLSRVVLHYTTTSMNDA